MIRFRRVTRFVTFLLGCLLGARLLLIGVSVSAQTPPQDPAFPMVFPVAMLRPGTRECAVRWRDTFHAPRDGGKRRHQGQDLMAPQMQPLLAAFDGRVEIRFGAGRAGHYLKLYGDNGAVAYYMHINNDTPGTNDGKGSPAQAFPPGIVSGARVCAGQLIGYCGNSGNAESARGNHHLHFELHVNGRTLNPAASLAAAARLDAPVDIAPVFYFEDTDCLRVKPQGRPEGAPALLPVPAELTDTFWTSRLDCAVRTLTEQAAPASAAFRLSLGDKAQHRAFDADWTSAVQQRLTFTGELEAAAGGPALAAGADPDLSAAFAQQSYQLFLLHGDSRFYDVYERILYNALLAEFQEMTAAMPPDEAEAGDRPAPPSARCLRTLHALPETIYAQNGGQLYVNQYLSSSARFTVNGVELMLRQQGAFPASGHTRLTFATPKPVYSVLLLRVPAWAKPRPESRGRYRYLETDAPQVTVAINGTPIAVAANRLGYLAIPRKWNNGDVVEVALPMPVRRVQPYSYRNNDQVAVECGPFVYGTERTAATPTLGDSAVLTPEAKAGEAAIIHVTTPGTESSAVTLVPYAALSRRPAAVWLARSLPVAPRVDTTDWPAQASAMASTAAASVATAPVAWTPTPPATAPAANQPAPPAPALPLPPTAPVAPIRFRALLIVKPESDLQVDGYLPVRGALSDAAITEVATAFTRDFPALVNRLTNGKVLMETVMVTSPRPLTTLGSDTAGCQLEAADVAQDVQEFAPAGKYDSIFVYYQPRDQRTGYVLPCGYGRASTGPETNGAGFASLPYDPAVDWQQADAVNYFVYAWMRHLDAFYRRTHLRLPACSFEEAVGKRYTGAPQARWQALFRDYLTGQVAEDDGTKSGLGDAAWRLGTLRDAARRQAARPVAARTPGVRETWRALSRAWLTPDFRTPERLAAGAQVIANGAADLAWVSSVPRSAAAMVDFGTIPDVSGPCMRLRLAQQPGVLEVTKRFAVQPHTNYVLIADIHTEGVRTEQPELGGARIAVTGNARPVSLVNTAGFTYVALPFHSGGQTVITVTAALGHRDAPAMGTAYFANMYLVPVL